MTYDKFKLLSHSHVVEDSACYMTILTAQSCTHGVEDSACEQVSVSFTIHRFGSA